MYIGRIKKEVVEGYLFSSIETDTTIIHAKVSQQLIG